MLSLANLNNCYGEDSNISVAQVSWEGVIEIDMRLRSYGNKGGLAITLDEFKTYYSDEGPMGQLERMALVKLRPVPGDPELGVRVIRLRDEFAC